LQTAQMKASLLSTLIFCLLMLTCSTRKNSRRTAQPLEQQIMQPYEGVPKEEPPRLEMEPLQQFPRNPYATYPRNGFPMCKDGRIGCHYDWECQAFTSPSSYCKSYSPHTRPYVCQGCGAFGGCCDLRIPH